MPRLASFLKAFHDRPAGAISALPMFLGLLAVALAGGVAVLIGTGAVAQPEDEDPPAMSGRFDRRMPFQNHSRVRIERHGAVRYIFANGLPEHRRGRFPNANNPNPIASQRYVYRVPAEPEPAEEITPLGRFPFGIALNGVRFDPRAAEWWRGDRESGWRYEPLSNAIDLGEDHNHAHVQRSGAYHYHGPPVGLIRNLRTGMPGRAPLPLLLGYAADGFPIYGGYCHADPKNAASELSEMTPGYRLKDGERPAPPDGPGGGHDGSFVQDYTYDAEAGDLDRCNGHFGVTPEWPGGTYHYHISEAFPFIPRAFRGEPDPSFRHRGPSNRWGREAGRRPRPPRFHRFGPPPPERDAASDRGGDADATVIP